MGSLAIVGVALLAQRLPLRVNSQADTPKHAKASSNRQALLFLALCTGLYWLFTWVWNPDYGGQRDWDLFSLAAIPSTLLLARLLPQALSDRSQLAQAGLMLTAVSAVHTMAWIYQNTLPWEWP
jgi:MFS superfamily sulfate permease-like transporter